MRWQWQRKVQRERGCCAAAASELGDPGILDLLTTNSDYF